MSRENNIRIAEYIGMQKTDLGWFDAEEVLINLHKSLGGNTIDEMDLSFDKSWDWLSPVISTLSLTFTRDNLDFDVMCYEVSDSILEDDLTRAYNAVIKFINN